MAQLTFKGHPITTEGAFPKVGEQAPEVRMVGRDLSEVTLNQFKGQKVIFNIFPSVDTAVCGLQLKTFNEKVSQEDNVALLFGSLDLPFAFARFCAAEGVQTAVTASDFRDHSLAQNYGVKLASGPLAGLYARAVLVLGEDHKIIYSELVQEVTAEPNYEAAFAALKG